MIEFLKKMFGPVDHSTDTKSEALARMQRRLEDLRERNGDKDRTPRPLEDHLERARLEPKIQEWELAGNDIKNYSGYCIVGARSNDHTWHDKCVGLCWCTCHINKINNTIAQADAKLTEDQGWCIWCDSPAHIGEYDHNQEWIYDPVTWQPNLGPEGWTPTA